MTVTLNPDPQVAVRPLTKTEKVMSRAMLAAWSAPQFNIVVDIDMQHALGQRRPGVTVTDIILSACAKALIQFPAMNAHFRDDAVHEYAPEWRPISAFSLTCDHRAVDGALAARFLGVVKDILEGCTT